MTLTTELAQVPVATLNVGADGGADFDSRRLHLGADSDGPGTDSLVRHDGGPALAAALASYSYWLILAAAAVESTRRARRNAETAFHGAERVVGRSYADRALALRQLAPHIDPPLGDLPARAWVLGHVGEPGWANWAGPCVRCRRWGLLEVGGECFDGCGHSGTAAPVWTLANARAS